ncbi:hypothetical protein COB21_02855 [Candidatus Aerophobetes bacterium]|uniref:Uncharacterized protein n=1 Tax=Aerophobetes bacterium TaxID=2030807 RepID=A0A2A4X4L2_UNCAE|nr:MAG: hypothetical protein COB21_02855 [Candidatus Aerophobetes bacterium]
MAAGTSTTWNIPWNELWQTWESIPKPDITAQEVLKGIEKTAELFDLTFFGKNNYCPEQTVYNIHALLMPPEDANDYENFIAVIIGASQVSVLATLFFGPKNRIKQLCLLSYTSAQSVVAAQYGLAEQMRVQDKTTIESLKSDNAQQKEDLAAKESFKERAEQFNQLLGELEKIKGEQSQDAKTIAGAAKFIERLTSQGNLQSVMTCVIGLAAIAEINAQANILNIGQAERGEWAQIARQIQTTFGQSTHAMISTTATQLGLPSPTFPRIADRNDEQ